MISIIIPVYYEPYLNKTIDSLLQHEGDIEVIPVIDGCPVEEPIRNDKRVKPIVLDKNSGMRKAINTGIEAAKGDYLMKIDAHCVIDTSYANLIGEENWLVIPRRYQLKEVLWDRNASGKIHDYHYLTFPGTDDPRYGYSFQVQTLFKKNDLLIDDTMSFQGSCWFANKHYFMHRVGYLDDHHYGPFAQEQQEIGLKYWLGGGEVKVNKSVWYAHLFKMKRHYVSAKFSTKHKRDYRHIRGNEFATRHWMDNKESGMLHPFSWLVEKFWPLPKWPENWQEVWDNEKLAHIR